ncbi:nitroreductase family protein [Streptomyces sp. NPDC007100]|uniref:nitroreductase family protein n=1 Tax=Streptomyces sp. NPDC007100 TaxID=3155602 RepID=UPI0033F244A8
MVDTLSAVTAAPSGLPRTGPPRAPSATAFMQTLLTRSVVRGYTDAPIDAPVVEALLDAMLAAPSGGNAQAWSFLAVQDRRTVRWLRGLSPGVIGLPPLIVVVCVDTTRSTDASGRRIAPLCAAMATQNLLLAAHAHGLGACPVHGFVPGVLRELLDLPDTLDPLLLVPVGHPAQTPQPSPRRPRSEVISYERVGLSRPAAAE